MNGGKQQTSLQKQLKLYPDEKGLLRCKGRIDNSPLDDSAKYPALLPKRFDNNGYLQKTFTLRMFTNPRRNLPVILDTDHKT